VTEVCISPEQRRVHVAGEVLAVAVVAPLLLYVAATTKDPVARSVSLAVGLGTLAVDSWLLWRWLGPAR
jgi:hypothetical protein